MKYDEQQKKAANNFKILKIKREKKFWIYDSYHMTVTAGYNYY